MSGSSVLRSALAILALLLTAVAAAAGLRLYREGLVQVLRDGRIWVLKDFSELAALWIGGLLILALVWWLRRIPVRRLAYGLLIGAGFVTLAAFLMHDVRPEISGWDDADAGGGERVTLLIGVDAMSWNAAIPLLKQGKLPHLERLMAEGAYGVLRSLETYRPSIERFGYWSPVVWTSIATGLRAEKHGISDFSIPDEEGRQRMSHSGHRRAPAFWNIFSAFGQPVGIVGWWASWPAEPVEGVMASSNLGLRGYRGARRGRREDASRLLDQEGLTHPESFVQVVVDEIGLPEENWRVTREKIYPLDLIPLREEKDLETFDSVLWQDRFYLEIARRLLRDGGSRLYSVYFEGIDAASHNFWEFMADPKGARRLDEGAAIPPGFEDHRLIVERYYRLVDEFIGELLAELPPDATVVICSDHGFKSVPEHVRGADHSGFGVFLARGEGIRRGENLNLSLLGSLEQRWEREVGVLDILPTLLYMHGLPVSLELDGRVLFEIFEPAYLRRSPLYTVAGYGDFGETRRVEVEMAREDEEEYLERLKGLGYLN